MIHVCYGLYDGDGKYAKWTGTSILSMLKNTAAPPNSITVHILHDTTLTKTNLKNFSYVAGRYRQNIEFHNIELLFRDRIQYLLQKMEKYINSRFSIGAFYRLFVSKNFFLPDGVSKIIYLDSDTIVNLDIAELWNTPLKDFPIAAVPENQATRGYMITNKYLLNSGQVKAEDYFCSGIVVLNLEKLGDNFFYDTVEWLSKNPECECPDQDALNHFFSKNYLKLPEKFNSFVSVSKTLDNNVVFKKIYHYAGQEALGLDIENAHDKLFFSYFTKSPWFNENILANMFEVAKKYYAQAKDLATAYSTISVGKKRVFFTSAELVETVKQIFAINDAEKVILEDEPNALSKLVKLAKTSHDENIFFIMSDNMREVKKELESVGLAEGQNFLDATLFLSDKHGIPLDVWSFLKEM